MQNDGMASHFRHLYFSDEVGVKKPNLSAFRDIVHKEQADGRDIIHIGDDLETDYAAAAGMGALYIHVCGTALGESPDGCIFAPSLMAALEELKAFMKP
jgi:FMN phosphatase YigB (HAD superfamily)